MWRDGLCQVLDGAFSSSTSFSSVPAALTTSRSLLFLSHLARRRPIFFGSAVATFPSALSSLLNPFHRTTNFKSLLSVPIFTPRPVSAPSRALSSRSHTRGTAVTGTTCRCVVSLSLLSRAENAVLRESFELCLPASSARSVATLRSSKRRE
jgi:hypothetical protein